MFFKKSNKLMDWVKNHSNKFDKLITWLIIWWAAASILWLSKTEKWKQITSWIKQTWFFKNYYSLFWKSLVKLISIFSKKK